MRMEIRAIRSEADYDWALSEIEPYFDSEPARGTPEAERFDVLAALIEAYEMREHPVEAPDPIEAIRSVMADRHLGQSDLATLLGSRSRASEILARKRRLSVEAIRRISSEWGLPADVLVRPYELASEPEAA